MDDLTTAGRVLVRFACERFGNLKPGEVALLHASAQGSWADLATEAGDQVLEKAVEWDSWNSWGEHRVVRAELLRWLYTERRATELVHQHGTRLRNAVIHGELDLAGLAIPHPIWMESCALPDGIDVSDATTRTISLEACRVDAVDADRVHVQGALLLEAGFATRRGVRVSDATVSGILSCSGAHLASNGDVALNLGSARIGGKVLLGGGFSASGEVRLASAKIGGNLDCDGGAFENPAGDALDADNIKVTGSTFLRHGFSAKGAVRLLGAKIGGNLECDQGVFENPSGNALVADTIDVRGSIYLREGFSAKGQVRLHGAKIGSQLEFSSGTFENIGGDSINADNISVKGDVFLRGSFSAKGEVRLLGAKIEGNLECDSGAFECSSGDALSADVIEVRGSIYLRNGFTAKGEVRLLGAKIGGNLECDRGTFENPSGDALSASGIEVTGSVFLREGFSAKGRVRLLGAKIKGQLGCKNGTFENPSGDALSADTIDVSGSVFLSDGFSAKGRVRLLGAKIGSNLECIKGAFENPSGDALSADNIDVVGDVFLRDGFSARGRVSLVGARIRGSFQAWGGSFNGNLDLDSSTLDQTLTLGHGEDGYFQVTGTLDLGDASVARIEDRAGIWDRVHAFDFQGFRYGGFVDGCPTDAKDRLRWLRKGLGDRFLPQPYRQLARALARMGHEDEAILVRQAEFRHRRDAERAKSFWDVGARGRWYGRWIMDVTLGCGYAPLRPLAFMLALWVLGGCLFTYAEEHGMMAPSSDVVLVSPQYVAHRQVPRDYEHLSPWMYSLDAMLPFVDLHQEKFWLPAAAQPCSICGCLFENATGLFKAYLWFHVIMGWTLGTLFAVGLVGLVHARERIEEGDGKAE